MIDSDVPSRTSYSEKSVNLGNSKAYPESYQTFQDSIESIFSKSELLLKCKIEFERRISTHLPDSLSFVESLNNDFNLSLIFTGAIKTGRSSLINLLLNTRVLPTNIIGPSCCVNIKNLKNDKKQVSVGVYDLEGWEVETYSDLNISELPRKIEQLQHLIGEKYCNKNRQYSKRIQVELPHWLLRNINIFECSALDGIHSLDEPFDLITKTEKRIVIHVLDATNGLMEWDRTFLAKLQYNWPHLPVFFVINHVDINPDVLIRDNASIFRLLSETIKTDIYESESEPTSLEETLDETFFTDGVFNESNHQNHVITKCKNQLIKLGYKLENNMTTSYTSLSVKEFFEILKEKKTINNCYWKMVETFFINFDKYISDLLESLLFSSLLELKCHINGIVDAVQNQICINIEMLDIPRDASLEDIRRTDNRMKYEFREMQNNFDKYFTTNIKEQLNKHKTFISKSLPIGNNKQTIRLLKPKLRDNFEKILLGKIDDYNINEEMNVISKKLLRRIETILILNEKSNNLYKYILQLFHSLKITIIYPSISRIPDDIIQSGNTWYKDLLKNTAQMFLNINRESQCSVNEIINDINATCIVKTAKLALDNISKQIQFLTMKYQESYKIALNWCSTLTNVTPEILQKLILIDFFLKMIETSSQKEIVKCKLDDLKKLTTFSIGFYDLEPYMVQRINIQSNASLTSVINIIFINRICRPNLFIMTHKSCKLSNADECILYYTKMDYDLLNAIQKGTLWEINDVIGILKQLANAVKYLLLYNQYIEIDLSPENIMLKKDKRGLHECVFCPFSKLAETQCISGKIKINSKAAIYQLGMVLSWLLTNDIGICEMISHGPDNSMTEFNNYLSRKTIKNLRQTNLRNLAVNCILQPEIFNNIKGFTNTLENI